MLSKVSVDKVFVHYFDKRSSSSSPPDPHRGSAPRPAGGHCPLLEKTPAGARANLGANASWKILGKDVSQSWENLFWSKFST